MNLFIQNFLNPPLEVDAEPAKAAKRKRRREREREGTHWLRRVNLLLSGNLISCGSQCSAV